MSQTHRLTFFAIEETPAPAGRAPAPDPARPPRIGDLVQPRCGGGDHTEPYMVVGLDRGAGLVHLAPCALGHALFAADLDARLLARADHLILVDPAPEHGAP